MTNVYRIRPPHRFRAHGGPARGQIRRSDLAQPIASPRRAQSTRATIQNCISASADGALSFHRATTNSRMDTTALYEHYRAIAQGSPIPIVVYNMPAVGGWT
ncbi:hypothetical protein BC936DRAFT_139881 [Jimgerdemannia flammicorona]|uniref:Dihydrodipicolinate synthase family protein n=1 Tax=Jimgerdemannia flammicorona TaxID=994334 RepID=A0A433DHC8_9FUNG|nr:hypothetical protein BC936DRAFT_139881 [Jimgerdemannia flammicorona]